MADVFSRQKRSVVMAAIRSTGNKGTEIRLITIFKKFKIKGWRRHQPLFGRPDFTFPGEKLVVFVDGCFWHGCKKHGHLPKTNKTYWRNKLIKNKFRDLKVTRLLQKEGWYVLRLWEHELKIEKRVAGRIIRRLSANRS